MWQADMLCTYKGSDVLAFVSMVLCAVPRWRVRMLPSMMSSSVRSRHLDCCDKL